MVSSYTIGELKAAKKVKGNVFTKTLFKQNDKESCLFKTEMCKKIETLSIKHYNSSEFRMCDNSEFNKLIDMVNFKDEFFRFIINTRFKWKEHYQKDEFYKLWFSFLSQIKNSLNFVTGFVTIREIKERYEFELMEKKNEMFLHIKNHPNLGNKEIAELKENDNSLWDAFYLKMSKYWAMTEMCAYPVSEQLDKEYKDFINNDSNHLKVNEKETKIEENIHQKRLQSDAENEKQVNHAFKEAFENQSRILEKKVIDKVLQLGNEVTSFRSDLKKSQDLEEKLIKRSQDSEEKVIDKIIQLGNKVTSVRSDSKKSQDLEEKSIKRSQYLEEKVIDKILQLGNEVTNLRSDLKKSQDLEEKSIKMSQDLEEKLSSIISQLGDNMRKSQDLGEKSNSTISQIGNEIVTLKSEVENVVDGQKTIKSSLSDKPVKPQDLEEMNSNISHLGDELFTLKSEI